MSWSRLKAKIEERFALSLRGRVSVHMTSYRDAVSEGGRGWLLIDGTEVPLASIQPYDKPRVAGQHDQWSLHDGFAAYLDLKVEEALVSPDPLHRALAMIDRRLGRRRFEGLRLSAEEHPWVRQLHELRAAAEQWRTSVDGAA
jgi:hypothetical protein